ncbi:MAG: endonuclease [Candidatus Eremiobacter antarcticus]|nr:GIY-YIG nuclease family protein [Candidatus Eremiobacteraeota bacterium]MBC5808590.1 GIY-YIG nuclease family protein [Candidatus Eremiobacteraeota bacterium]PZR61143.1 MAG: endonuclease [Candidatus Eremiobacter sp. RRmetagenome_bin22]
MNRPAQASWHFVYLARANDGSFYCGYARAPEARIKIHNEGKGSKSLRGRLPVRLVYQRRFFSKSEALRCELALKRRSHTYKGALARRWMKRKSLR